MNIEVTIFLLRLLGVLSLLGFLLALFVVIWRNAGAAVQPLAAAGAGPGYLVCEQPRLAGDALRCTLRPIVTLGRAAGNTVVVSDDFASANHARILLESGKWWLEDRQSRNGTLLNGETIIRRTILTDGDEIGIGRHRYRLHLNQENLAI